MKNFDKIYPAKISRPVDWTNFGTAAKALFFKLLPFAKPLILFALFGAVGLFLQVLTVGICDRFLSISPKISLLGSSLFFAAIFASLAIVGGLKRKELAEVLKTNLKAPPLCKMLIIRKKI